MTEITEAWEKEADATLEQVDELLGKNKELQDVEDIETGDYPEAAQENARMALEAREETGNPNDCGTRVGWERANQLDNGEDLSEETINRMAQFERHEDNKEQGEEGRADCGWLMWNAWGGDEGIEWAQDKVDEFEEAREMSGSGNSYSIEEFEDTYLSIWKQAIATDATDRQLLGFSDSQTPEFVKEQLRETIFGDNPIFGDIEGLQGSDLTQLRLFLEEELVESDGWTIDGVADRLMDLDVDLSRDRAELIARTETAATLNSARETGYEEQGLADDEEFYWTGATQAEDDRTTDACDWLIKQTNPNHGGDPVSLSKLEMLIDEAPKHDDDMQDNLARPQDKIVHPNERKTWVRNV